MSATTNLLKSILPRLGNGEIVFEANNPKNIAIVNWENIGDFVLFTPVVRQIRMNFPNSKIIMVTQESMKVFSEACPYVDEWMTIKGHRKAKAGTAYGAPTSYFYKLLSTYFKLLFFAHGKIDYIFGPDWLLFSNPKQPISNLLQNKTFSKTDASKVVLKTELYKENEHQVPRMLSIIEMYGVRVFDNHLENWLYINDEKDTTSVNSEKKLITIPIGAGQLRREWPLERIAELCHRISSTNKDYRFVFVGPASMATDENLEILRNVPNSQILIGKTSLAESAKIVSNSEMIISNDSGMAHIAASLGTKTIVVSSHALDADKWHLNSPARYRPWQNISVVLQPKEMTTPCVGNCSSEKAHCILGVSVNDAYDAFLSIHSAR